MYIFELSETGLLGSGAHGIVRAARHKVTQELVAIKVMPTSVLAAVAKELIAQARVDHPSIVRLMGTQVDLDRKRVYMVMELCRGGELFDRIAESGRLDEVVARRHLTEMCQAIDHCHDLNVYHRDLKPENILLDEHDHVKIADFGLAAMVHQVQEDASFLRHTKCGSLMYAAPEVLTSDASKGYDAAKADIWSLGIILYSMLSGALPFSVAVASRCPRYAVVQQHGVRVLCEANGFSKDASDLLVAMIEPDPTRRVSAKGVLSSAWVQAGLGAPAAAALSQPALGVLQKWSTELGDKPFAVPTPNPSPRPPAAPAPIQAPAVRAASESDAAEGKRRHSSTLTQAEERASKQQKAAEHEPPAAPSLAEPSDSLPLQPSDSNHVCPSLLGANDPAEEVPPGVNGMLVRSLGWVQLPEEKEKMVGDVASALDALGVKYEVVKGELSDVVWVGHGPDAADATENSLLLAPPFATPPPIAEFGAAGKGAGAPLVSVAGSTTAAIGNGGPLSSTPSVAVGGDDAGTVSLMPPSPAEKYSEGRLCVRMRVVPEASGETSQIHIDRQAGDVLQFHSFYRDVRNQLAGANGWVENHGRYIHDVYKT